MDGYRLVAEPMATTTTGVPNATYHDSASIPSSLRLGALMSPSGFAISVQPNRGLIPVLAAIWLKIQARRMQSSFRQAIGHLVSLGEKNHLLVT